MTPDHDCRKYGQCNVNMDIACSICGNINMKKFRLSVHTGPCCVKEIAEKCREAGLNVVCEGTERIYIDFHANGLDNARCLAQMTLEAKHGTNFGLRFW
jgi:hypothetical protein